MYRIIFVALVSFVSCSSSVLSGSNDLSSLKADDFVKSLTGHQSEQKSFDLIFTITNPTSYSICVYEGILNLSDVVLEAHPDRRVVGVIDSPNVGGELVFGGEYRGAIDHPQSPTTFNQYRPNIEIPPSASYTFSQKRSFTGYIELDGDALIGSGLQVFPAPASKYKVKIRSLQIFICNRTGFFTKNAVQNKILSFDEGRERSITADKQSGTYWIFDDVLVGANFFLSLPNPPVGLPVIIYD
jgi:hypothetical protein